ncbi:MAG: indole-3-glycerol phosphate synthase TrpC [Candidatus Omnitrophica bacterium]|nr:indole-3-glycerol phosphate synthase TrpC [Candidatus Omnitrophota bacterium]
MARNSILAEILEDKRREVEEKKVSFPEERILKQLPSGQARRDFKAAVSQSRGINLIAELKKSSPSKGVLRDNFEPQDIARIFENSGASALSVVTEERFFQGKLDYIKRVKEATLLPVLRKDFIIDAYQLYESLYFGADAVLLIADILSEKDLKDFVRISESLNIEPLVEVHTKESLIKALALDSVKIIGINNRDLHNFRVDINTTVCLKNFIPQEKTVVSESGISSYKDVMYLKSIGINAVLIGEVFMLAKDIGAKVKEVMGC